MNILHVTPAFYPATYWGGPIWSTKAVCDGVAAIPQVSLRVLTTDAAGPERNDCVAPAALPYPVTYARRVAGHSIAPALVAQLPAAMAWADVVHLTGVYNTPTLPVFALARLMGKPLVWSPRGALQATHDWAQAPKRRLKHGFEHLLNLVRPPRAVMHVTAQSEAAASLQRLSGMPTKVIANCVDIPDQINRKAGDGLRLIFLGRLHPKKGLAELMQAMRKLPDDVTLDIYGSGQADYERALQRTAAGLGARVRLRGHVDDAGKAAAFARADLFVLPSHSENFAISVAEAMAHGVPVLTTTGTPWQAVEARGCGRCMRLDQDDLAAEIRQLATQDLPAMGMRGRAWMRQDFAPDAMVAAFADLYRELLPVARAEVRA